MKKQGIFLSVMILFLVIGDLQIPYYLLNQDQLRTIYSDIPSWYPVYAIAGLLSNIAIIIGMWRMKKWAVYVLGAYFASKILVDWVYILPDKQLLVSMTTLVGAGLWFRIWLATNKTCFFQPIQHCCRRSGRQPCIMRQLSRRCSTFDHQKTKTLVVGNTLAKLPTDRITKQHRTNALVASRHHHPPL